MQAIVVHRGVERKARGFSCKELVDADMTCEQAYELKAPLDGFRRSSHKHNVEMLKKAKATLKVEPKVAKPKAAQKPAAKKA